MKWLGLFRGREPADKTTELTDHEARRLDYRDREHALKYQRNPRAAMDEDLRTQQRATAAHEKRVAEFTTQYAETIHQLFVAKREASLQVATGYITRGGRGPAPDPLGSGGEYALAARHFIQWVKDTARSGEPVPKWEELEREFYYFATGYAAAREEYQVDRGPLWEFFVERFELLDD